MLSFVFLNLPRLADMSGDFGFVGTIQSLAVLGGGDLRSRPDLLPHGCNGSDAVLPRKGTVLIRRLVPAKHQAKALGLAERFMEGLASLRSPPAS